jgi:hypothetical protein
MTMNRDRFEEVAEIYGADVARWPAQAREDAAVLMAAEPEFAQAALERARHLDAALDAWRPALPSGALADRIAATAPGPRAPWARWVLPTAWAASLAAGLAAACAAGALLGVELSGHVASRIEARQAQTAAVNAQSEAATGDAEEGA